jgi:hypothetical protein
MTNAQYKWVIALLVMIGLALVDINLDWAHRFGYGDWTPSLILFRIGSAAVYTEYGLKGVILGVIVPLCLFAVAAYMAFRLRLRSNLGAPVNRPGLFL